jgi:hypothetical protein
VRTKYFTLRPRPLEDWLWRNGVSPSAERVFWLHWQEGMRSRDWCSSIPIRRVAALCSLDVSSVTRAYQLLSRLGLVRRQDPGRDPARPFEQAVAITEVRLPRTLMDEWQRHPDRRTHAESLSPTAQPRPQPQSPICAALPAADAETPVSRPDPFAGKSGLERHRALSALLAQMSSAERRIFDAALRRRHSQMAFDEPSRMDDESRRVVLQVLSIAAASIPAASTPAASNTGSLAPTAVPESTNRRQRLSQLEMARLRRELQSLTDREGAALLLREVIWSVEQGALSRFAPLHGLRIALKKVREGLWTRPHRMPPNWARHLSDPAASNLPPLELCRSA